MSILCLREPYLHHVLPDISLDVPEPIGAKIESLIEKVGFTFSDILDRDGKKISALVCAIFDDSSELIHLTEHRIRELLMDHHGTFSLFSKGVNTACQKALDGEKVSVELYVQDMSHPDFLDTLKVFMAKGGDPELLIIEIRADDCGVISSKTLENLRRMDGLGFRYSLNDFTISDGEIRATHLEKIAKVNILPVYIRIAKNILEEMRRRVLNIAGNSCNILLGMIRKGVKILSGDVDVSHKIVEEKPKSSLSFLDKSKMKKEGMYNIYGGDPQVEECLFLPGDGMSVPQALDRLIAEGMTGDLMRKQINEIIGDVNQGRKTSVNAYIKDIGSADFRKTIESIMMKIPRYRRSALIFELLEVKYGSMNEQVLANLRFLQEEGFAIAIDDLLLGDHVESMSEEILFALHEAGIYLDYIKIDGSIGMSILKGTISESDMSELIQIMHQYSELSGKTMFVLEWIQNTAHASHLLKVLNMNPEKILFQGMYLNKGEKFGIPHANQDIHSGKLTHA